MTYYTDSNQIEELIKQIADVEVKPLGALETWSGVTVYLFDNLFEPLGKLPEICWHVNTLLWHRPDWGAMILKLMKNNEEVYLFCGYWSRPLYCKERNDFRFVHCNEPVMDADRTCLINTKGITYMMREAIRDLMEPIRFGQDMARRVLGESEEPRVKSLLTFTKGDYKEICLEQLMEQLMDDVMRQRELWKDRFFYYAISAYDNDLCAICKEEMRQAFYVNGNEEKALGWRPGNREGKSGCASRNCKHFSWQSFEDGYYDSTTETCKNEEYESD